MLIQKREFTDLEDIRLVYRGNKILSDLFRRGTHSIRQLCFNEADTKGFYRFLLNDRVSEDDIVNNMAANCTEACKGKFVVCIQDTTEVNLSSHSNRINKDDYLGTTNAKNDKGLGFFLHPSLVLDAQECIPYGYADVKIWNRSLEHKSKFEREYNKLPIEEKESYKWIEVSQNTQSALRDQVTGMVIIQDREGDIYEQFATIPDEKTDLLIRARTDRTLKDKNKLFSCLSDQQAQGRYQVTIAAKNGRQKRIADLEIRYRKVTICATDSSSKNIARSVDLYLIEAKEINFSDTDRICWRLLTTIPVQNVEVAKMCIEWYSWRWTVEEVFKVLKKEGYNIEASELEYASSIRKMSLLIMETVIKLFLMRLAYAEPETEISADTCFTKEEQEFLEHQISRLQGKTSKQKNPYQTTDLKRYVWAIARLGGWKGYESKRHPGITTLWTGLKYFNASCQGWEIMRNVSTR
ncbi:MAG TPA: IS4 family transposase [Puia sp.]|nr:IS4 family transposase [Puia sp.]